MTRLLSIFLIYATAGPADAAPGRARAPYFFMPSLDIESFDIESFFIEPFDMLSFDIVSFFIESLDMLSFDIVSFFMLSAKAAGANARLKPSVAAASARAMRERVMAYSSRG
jgi:hypothetical protein